MRARSNLLWLLIVLIIALVILPPLGYAMAAHVPDRVMPFVALPMATQIDLAAALFGHRLFPLNEFMGPYPAGITAWTVIAGFWTTIALAIWILVRYLWSLRTRYT